MAWNGPATYPRQLVPAYYLLQMGSHVRGCGSSGRHENIPQPLHRRNRLLGSLRSVAGKPEIASRGSRLSGERKLDPVGRNRLHGRRQHCGFPIPMEKHCSFLFFPGCHVFPE